VTEYEQKRPILLYVGSRTKRGEPASEADIRKVLEWATGVRNEAAMLELVWTVWPRSTSGRMVSSSA
jgi:hypothetical protein